MQRLALESALPLSIGSAIYLLWRTADLRVFHWLSLVGAGSALDAARSWASPATEYLPDWFIYSLPDGLWVYAVCGFMLWMWRGDEGAARIGWFLVGPVLALGWEIGQAMGFVPGAFDWVDVGFCLAAAILAWTRTCPPALAKAHLPEGLT